MNLILLFPEDFPASTPERVDAQGGRVCLRGRRLEHVREIHRAEVGDDLCVGLRGQRIGRGVIVRVDREVLELDVEFQSPAPTPLPVVLVLALPRPLVLKRVLISATAMGVKKIYLIASNRVERSFWSSKVMRGDAILEPLVLGLEQARDTIMPEIELRTHFRSFAEDELPELVKGRTAVVAHPDHAVPCPRILDTPGLIAIGPEGGFIPHEVDKFRDAGCSVVSLGDRILRVETAVPVLLSRASP